MNTTPRIYILTVEVETSAEALALRQRLQDLGHEPEMSVREPSADGDAANSSTARTRDTTLGKIVLGVVAAGPEDHIWSHTDFLSAILEAGLAKNSITPTLQRLSQQGDLVMIGKGLYVRGAL